MNSKSTLVLTTLCAALALAGCGGGDDGGSSSAGGGNGGGNDGGGTTTPPAATFSETGEWSFKLPASGVSLCYDFDTKAEVADCAGTTWDLKVTGSGSTATLWTNSGVSGSGKGGGYGGPFDHTWAELKTYKNGTTDPASGEALPSQVYIADTAASVFAGTNDIQSQVFEYDLAGDHRLYPNFRVFLVTTNSASAANTGDGVFALQVTGYYGGTGGSTSGYPSIRWVSRTDGATVQTATINATGNDWVYFDLVNNRTVGQADAWQIAFNRYNIKLNGGTSGSGTVAGFLAGTPDGFYDASGQPVLAKFTSATNLQDTLPLLTSSTLGAPATASKWVKDSVASILNPAYRGTYPAPLDYGWYAYNPTTHFITANADQGTLIRSGEGDSYARVHLSSIVYADTGSPTSQQTWTFGYDVQPSSD